MKRRPSTLTMAEKCGMAAHLAEKFPETSDPAERGSGVHLEIAIGKPQSPEAKAAWAWLSRRHPGADVQHERRVQLADPETGEVLTEGTADVVVHIDDVAVVYDWKTGMRDNVAPAGSNLQLLTYGVAVALADGANAFRVAAVFLDGDSEPHVDESPLFTQAEWWPLLESIKAAASKPVEAKPGEHCRDCYQRRVCPSYQERTKLALTLVAKPNDIALTDATAAEMILRVKQVREAADLAEEMVRAHVSGGGRVEAAGKVYLPTNCNGRETADVAALKRDGLEKYVKRGNGYQTWKWVRA